MVERLYAGNENAGIPAVVTAIAREGGLEGTQAEIARYVERAKAALEPLPTSAAKEELGRLADALAAP
jgi:geranylgeranyl pyrophosphate synthase